MRISHLLFVLVWCDFTNCIRAQTNLTLVGQVNDGGTAQGVALSGHYAFLANGTDGLRSYDVQNQTNPVSIGHINDGDSAEDVAVVGHFAYLADGNDGLRIYDISNPTNIVGVSNTNNGGYTYRIAATNNTCFLGNLSGDVFIYDISDPINPVLLARTNVVEILGMTLQGNYLYTADESREIHILDISVPSKPILLNTNFSSSASHDSECVTVQGHFAFVGDGEHGLTLFDISDPSNPTALGHGTGGSPMPAVISSGNYIYAATDNALKVFDVTDPANILLVAQAGTSNIGANECGLKVAGGYAYFADYSNGLLIYALGQSTSPPLSIMQTDINQIVISWPAPAAAFALQWNADLTTTNWETTTNLPTVVGNNNQITLQISFL